MVNSAINNNPSSNKFYMFCEQYTIPLLIFLIFILTTLFIGCMLLVSQQHLDTSNIVITQCSVPSCNITANTTYHNCGSYNCYQVAVEYCFNDTCKQDSLLADNICNRNMIKCWYDMTNVEESLTIDNLEHHYHLLNRKVYSFGIAIPVILYVMFLTLIGIKLGDIKRETDKRREGYEVI